ncbi:MAG: TIGR00725 family protein, partial [Bacteroidota bacterium]
IAFPGCSTGEGNPYLSFAVATGLGEARNAVIARTADALIAVGGEFGTLSEIALALKMGKPVVGLKSWSIKSPRDLNSSIIQASTPLEAVKSIFQNYKDRI